MAQRLRVLLVEDSKVLTERLTEAIRQISDVDLVGTADSEAGALAAVKRDAVDVIILDLHLKQGTGFGVLRATADLPRRAVTVVLTNFALSEYQREASALGVRYFLDKAREFERIAEVLREVAEAAAA